MENRRPLHYHRNTINAPIIGQKNFDRRQAFNGPIGSVIDPPHTHIKPNTQFKHYARHTCVWCGDHWDIYRIMCPTCNNCQYCGFVGGSQTSCHLCGNTLPIELHESVQIQTIRVG